MRGPLARQELLELADGNFKGVTLAWKLGAWWDKWVQQAQVQSLIGHEIVGASAWSPGGVNDMMRCYENMTRRKVGDFIADECAVKVERDATIHGFRLTAHAYVVGRKR